MSITFNGQWLLDKDEEGNYNYEIGLIPVVYFFHKEIDLENYTEEMLSNLKPTILIKTEEGIKNTIKSVTSHSYLPSLWGIKGINRYKIYGDGILLYEGRLLNFKVANENPEIELGYALSRDELFNTDIQGEGYFIKYRYSFIDSDNIYYRPTFTVFKNKIITIDVSSGGVGDAQARWYDRPDGNNQVQPPLSLTSSTLSGFDNTDFPYNEIIVEVNNPNPYFAITPMQSTGREPSDLSYIFIKIGENKYKMAIRGYVIKEIDGNLEGSVVTSNTTAYYSGRLVYSWNSSLEKYVITENNGYTTHYKEFISGKDTVPPKLKHVVTLQNTEHYHEVRKYKK